MFLFLEKILNTHGDNIEWKVYAKKNIGLWKRIRWYKFLNILKTYTYIKK